ncbi:M36 family metallopeptidase [Alteromonas mediterranea]|uniref:M36 family metallopeptidase n=1 Tax=Alteromonas mediterranea TaxID=314275 RepID=UPI0012FC3FD2|nr:M36 family metallopeptidase [Alteromonas mediterranea]QGX60877.1 peptidase M36 [Alteromonas mediterranea]
MKKRTLVYAAVAAALPFVASASHVHAPLDTSSHRIAEINLTDNVLNPPANNVFETALEQLKTSFPSSTVRTANGHLDSVFGIAIDVAGSTPEEMGADFISRHSTLLGGLNEANFVFNPHKSKAALGGYLVRFDQAIDGVKIKDRGVGLLIDKSQVVRAAFADTTVDTPVSNSNVLSANSAISVAAADLALHKRALPTEALDVLSPAFSQIEKSLGVFAKPIPQQIVVQDNNELKLAWKFFYYSTNPFGVFEYVIDAQSGEILARNDRVKTILPTGENQVTQTGAVQQTADYFPTFPPITTSMQSECLIEDEAGGYTGKPKGMERINLRKFDDSNLVTGVEGLLTGKHALIESAMLTKGPFPQAATGTYHFSEDAGIEARPVEDDHVTPSTAHHIDGISQFIYITTLLEYLDYLHKDGDAVHSRGVGDGAFPNSYPNESVPLTGVVHIPNVLDPPDNPADPEFMAKLLGLDNAFAVPLSQEIAGEEVVVNPTAYGHGYLFNNLAMDFSVPIHEGTHATITPIAGFEGEPEGGALNEGQADLWAYTVGETPDLGTYPVNACDLRKYLRELDVDPDSFEFIRSAQSQIRYSQLGTRDNAFEVHRDGEIYAGAMWDLRELMVALQPKEDFVRPDPVTGDPTQQTSLGKETWERIFLGSMYVLGVSAPDTFVRARDAVLIADAALYPSDPLDLTAPGRHHALIERVFAARELGVNAKAPLGGRQTISSAVSEFTANQDKPSTPAAIDAHIISDEAIEVTWDTVPEAFAYQVLKRKKGASTRLFTGVPNREYFDGDLTFSGFTHVEFVVGDNHYIDKGQGLGRGAGQGIDSFDYEYVVRAISLNPNQQVGFSNMSGIASTALNAVDVSSSVDYKVGNVNYNHGIFAFDIALINTGDERIYGPVDFDITHISNNSISVLNADNGGTGQSGDIARFRFDQSLDVDKTSALRYLKFDNPNGKLFTFTARINGYEAGASSTGRGETPTFDTSEPKAQSVVYHNIEEHTGVILIGAADEALVDGVDYVDIPFTALPSASSVVATLSADVEVVAVPDLDFELLDAEGNIMASSGNLGSNEQVGGGIVPGETYRVRVNGWANGPTSYRVVIDQFVSDINDANVDQNGNATTGTVTFEFNPETGKVLPLSILN